MGGSSKAPTPPDPTETGAAQTSTNVNTAIANAFLQNMDRTTPDGSLTYDQTGSYTMTGPDGTSYQIPRFTATETLSPVGEQIRQQNNETQLGMAQIGNQATDRLGSLLSSAMDFRGVPEIGPAPGTSPDQITADMFMGDVKRSGILDKTNPYKDAVNPYAETTPAGDNPHRFGGDKDAKRAANPYSRQNYFGDDYSRKESYGFGTRTVTEPSAEEEAERKRLSQEWNAARKENAQQWDARQERKGEKNAAKAAEWEAENKADRRAWREKRDAAQERYDRRYGRALTKAEAAAEEARAKAEEQNAKWEVDTSPVGDYAMERQRVEDALLGRLQGSLDQRRKAKEADLLNSGISYGSAAYNAAQDDLSRGENDAQLAAILGAGQEQSRLVADALAGRQDVRAAQAQSYNQAQSVYNTNLAARQQGLSEQYARRNQPINEITALLSGSQVSSPGFQVNTPGGIPTVDQAGLINANYDQQFQKWQQDQQSKNDIIGGLLGFSSGLIRRPY